MADIEIAPAINRRNESRVLDLDAGGGRLVAIFDGSGSWGSGLETAAWVQSRLAEAWKRSPPADAAKLVLDFEAAANAIPDDLKDSEWGLEPTWAHDFWFAAVLVLGRRVHVITDGSYGALRFGSREVISLYEPRTWVMEQVAAGILTEAEALEHPLRKVLTRGAVPTGPVEAYLVEPVELAPGEGVVIADLDLFRVLQKEPVESWAKLSAARLQALGTKDPVIRIAEGFPAA